jgi:hypothetical protein
VPEAVEVDMEFLAGFEGLLGPTPINLETLTASPHIYVREIWTFLNEMELANLNMGDDRIVDECDFG